MSTILSADDLNDFITPGVACIKPVETLPATAPPSLETEVVLDGTPGAVQPTAPARISLTDCLACSGCVTSAEAILVSLQSHAEILSVLDAAPALTVEERDGGFRVDGLENGDSRILVASVAPQVRASLAAAIGNGVSEERAGWVMEEFLRKELAKRGKYGNSFQWVLNTNTAREACLTLGADEILKAPASSFATTKKPILASSCPGWVCYAEKTHPYVLPHLSKVKSPQALLGTLVKSTLSRKLGVDPQRVYHVAVMPCFDKKLEASREELTDSVWQTPDGKPAKGVRDVDCVITTTEIITLAKARDISIFDLAKSITQPSPQPPFPDHQISAFLLCPNRPFGASRSAGPSGGNLWFLLSALSAATPGSQIITTRGRNADVVEYTVTSPSGTPLLRAARYYGFRNIQNLVRRLKPSKASAMPGGRPFGSARGAGVRKAGEGAVGGNYAYVEVMACPGGCTNGGGQIKADDEVVVGRNMTGESDGGTVDHKAWLAAVDEAYYSGGEEAEERKSEGEVVLGVDMEYVRGVMKHWAEIVDVGLEKLAYTTFREVVSDVGKTSNHVEKAVAIVGKVDGGW